MSQLPTAESGLGAWRRVLRVVQSQPMTEGAGVVIRRVMPINLFEFSDPFLLLDEIHSDDPSGYIAGFPPHPHRGIETVTMMVAGRMRHRDSTGGEGLIEPGDVQWMTASSGIIHSEMPEQEAGLMWGFQLWINLPASEKMTRPPSYHELLAACIPTTVTQDDSRVRIIAGSFGGVPGPAPKRYTDPLLLDVSLRSHSHVTIDIPQGHSCFVYVYDGVGTVDDALVRTKHAAVLGDGSHVSLASVDGARMLVVAGRPLGEPVYRLGPFVMNSEAEVRQAIADYQDGKFTEATA